MSPLAIAALATDLFVGLVGGALGAVLLELWLKPRRIRRQVASLLLAEIDADQRVLLDILGHEEPRVGEVGMDRMFALHRTGLDAVITSLGELRTEAAAAVLEIYRTFDRISAFHQRRMDSHEKVMSVDPQMKAQASENFHVVTRVFIRNARHGAERAVQVAAILQRVPGAFAHDVPSLAGQGARLPDSNPQ